MEELFSSDASHVEDKMINSKHEYLRWGQNWASFKWDRTVDVQKTCKALLPIEVKNAGALNENIFVWLAKHQVMLGQSGDNVLRDELADDWLSLDSEPESSTRSVSEEATLRAIKGTISMIGQVIRYGIHYGVTYVILTDYEHGVVFEIPAGLHTYQTKSHKDKEQPPETVQWTFVHKDKLRWAVAAALWNACQAITLSMEDLEENLP